MKPISADGVKMSLLTASGINSYYGDSHILRDVGLRVEEGEVVALLGRNGAGKTTTLNTLMGVVGARSGNVEFDRHAIHALSPEDIARLGIQLVPEDRRIFGSLTVEENLRLAAMSAPQPLELEEIYKMFPRLQERRKSNGRHLSGGEQQMLTIARALIRRPKLLMLDEPFEGLAPVIVQLLAQVVNKLAQGGQTIIIVEQNIDACLSLADRAYILSNGTVVYEGETEALRGELQTLQRYLSV
jgi:branched-chain amino acid transport system ATP-binding protein